ncbi:MAG: DUF485 domain-containing protein [Pseudonocardia sp.]
MSQEASSRIARDPRFTALADRRNRLAWTLFGITMVIYFGLVLVATFAPAVLAIPVSPGGTVSIGWPLGALTIIVPWLLTIYYVRRANAEGREMAAIVEEASR